MQKLKMQKMLLQREENNCKECKVFIRKFKRWDEKKVPKVSIMDYAECKKCNMGYDIYKGMVYTMRFLTKVR